jgi:Tetrahydrofolate dehydrogenase/cyclohydrolase, catalytic domain
MPAIGVATRRCWMDVVFRGRCVRNHVLALVSGFCFRLLLFGLLVCHAHPWCAHLPAAMALFSTIESEVRQRITGLRSTTGQVPGLRIFQVGNEADSTAYIAAKCRAAHRVGMNCEVIRFPLGTPEAVLLEAIEHENAYVVCMYMCGLLLVCLSCISVCRALRQSLTFLSLSLLPPAPPAPPPAPPPLTHLTQRTHTHTHTHNSLSLCSSLDIVETQMCTGSSYNCRFRLTFVWPQWRCRFRRARTWTAFTRSTWPRWHPPITPIVCRHALPSIRAPRWASWSWPVAPTSRGPERRLRCWVGAILLDARSPTSCSRRWLRSRCAASRVTCAPS